jgi:hypothetical protein
MCVRYPYTPNSTFLTRWTTAAHARDKPHVPLFAPRLFFPMQRTKTIMSRLFQIVAAISIAVVAVSAVQISNETLHYDVERAMEWLHDQGCHNATINMCPGKRLCTDAEYYSRALAAGGVIALDPNSKNNIAYQNYSGYNLCLSPGLISFLEDVGFKGRHENTTFPIGSIAFTEMYPPGMPYFATGGDRCQSHTPIVANGPHCGMPCIYFIPRIVYVWKH